MTEVRTIKRIELTKMTRIWPGNMYAAEFKTLDGDDGREVHAATEVE